MFFFKYLTHQFDKIRTKQEFLRKYFFEDFEINCLFNVCSRIINTLYGNSIRHPLRINIENINSILISACVVMASYL